jgi:CspA family cold shock protein
MIGQVLRTIPAKGFGFVLGEDGQEYFIHASECPEGDFDKLRPGQKVEFIETKTNKGFRATSLRKMS